VFWGVFWGVIWGEIWGVIWGEIWGVIWGRFGGRFGGFFIGIPPAEPVAFTLYFSNMLQTSAPSGQENIVPTVYLRAIVRAIFLASAFSVFSKPKLRIQIQAVGMISVTRFGWICGPHRSSSDLVTLQKAEYFELFWNLFWNIFCYIFLMIFFIQFPLCKGKQNLFLTFMDLKKNEFFFITFFLNFLEFIWILWIKKKNFLKNVF
jgi:hypothetical protein